ncbi:hypothetical protein GOODEAATRI_006741 [Goodea atripinnis]|uniref:Vestigial n=1 Tax=Goodea atripinnis TaxID=208336 RepID=A0ABV0PVV1_9TELE
MPYQILGQYSPVWLNGCCLTIAHNCSSKRLSPLRQSRGAMAVANFQYITRMSSGFKVYILEADSNYDHVLEEHFQRSLGANYPQSRAKELSISVSVDDHFAKALGEDKWLQIKSKSSSCSSTPPSSPSVTHSPTYNHSPNQSHKESSLISSHWPLN